MMFGITMGDSSGVGPEIVLKAAAAGALRHPFVVFGDAAVLERANRDLGYGLRIVVSDEASPPGDACTSSITASSPPATCDPAC